VNCHQAKKRCTQLVLNSKFDVKCYFEPKNLDNAPADAWGALSIKYALYSGWTQRLAPGPLVPLFVVLPLAFSQALSTVNSYFVSINTMHSHSGFVTTQTSAFPYLEVEYIAPRDIFILLVLIHHRLTLSSLSYSLCLFCQQTATYSAKMVFAAARTTARKAANFISHGGHNGPGQSAVHRLRNGAPVRHASTNVHIPNGLGFFPFKPPRSPAHRLFSQPEISGLESSTD